MSRSLAVDLAKYKIRVNTLVAGSIRTDRYEQNIEKYLASPMSKVPLNEPSLFEDIADGVWFLSSDEARMVTGTELTVDGGALTQLCYEEEGIK